MTVDRRLMITGLLASLARPALGQGGDALGSSAGQGFAGLGRAADGFALPRPDHVFAFPADHGAHPAFRIEWWYLTANLKDTQGRDLGLQWTLFRSALKPEPGDGWSSPQLWMGHAAVTTPDAHYHAEKLARGGVGQAGVSASPFAAWIDDWQMAGPDFDTLRLTAAGDGFGYDVALTAQGPLIFHGENGYSVKSAGGQASHYYSQPFFAVSGTLHLPEGDIAVTGTAWLDREWSSQPLAADQSGWDWFSLTFEGGEKLMAFRLRGGRGDYTSATWITPDGQTTALPDGALTVTPRALAQVAGRQVPVDWTLKLAEKALDLRVTAINPQSWMGTRFAYWEGPVRVSGNRTGRGYLEMTGY